MVQRTNTRRMHELRDAFFQDGLRLDGDPTTRDLASCWLCGDRIDYIAAPGTTPDSHNLDHYHPVSDFPELAEDPDNFRHAHASCNQHRGNRAPTAGGLGEPMPVWW
ncbi:HNH endonuclease [Microbacterium sp. CPCC 204701]|uniref:HNH endonuclease n=1 Tax=Microbacterium sp. CPCC 204701 TaxID=2493084 RepID=UPI001F0BDD62|nr:HNH endonuclease [Microbacterium sp. CPCC 204701]